MQDHCCIPLQNKRTIISASSSFPLTLSRSDMTECALAVPLSPARLVSAAAIRSCQINAGEFGAHVKIHHSEEQSTASAPTCSTVIQHSAWSEEEVICLCNSLHSPSASLAFLSLSPPLLCLFFHMHTLVLSPPHLPSLSQVALYRRSRVQG